MGRRRHADYIARDIDLEGSLQKMKEGARELDPRRSPGREQVEDQLATLPRW